MEAGDSVGLSFALSMSNATLRKQAFRPAEPLEEHTIASIAFLKRVDTIQLVGGDKKTFQFTLQLHADPHDETSTPASFTISRSYEEIDHLSKIAHDACCRHFDLKRYSVPICQLCKPFQTKVKLPVTTKHRLLRSTHYIQAVMEARVVALVRGATVPPTNEKLFCEGVVRLPAAVTRFLLTGVDQTKL